MDDSDPMAIPPFLRRTPATEPTEENDMGRRKKQDEPSATETAQNIPENIPAGTEAAPIGHNSKAAAPALTEEQRQILAIGYKRKLTDANAKKDQAVAAIRNLKKTIKADLGDKGVKLVEEMIALDTDEGEAKMRADIQTKLEAARFMALPFGSQLEMFPDRMPAEDRAYAEGKRDAMAGEALRNLYDPSVPQFGRYAEGWHDGQRAVVDAQRARDAEVFDGVSAEEAAALADIEANGLAGAIGTAAPTYETAH